MLLIFFTLFYSFINSEITLLILSLCLVIAILGIVVLSKIVVLENLKDMALFLSWRKRYVYTVPADIVNNVSLGSLNSGKRHVLLSRCLIVKLLILFNRSRSIFIWVIVIFHFHFFFTFHYCIELHHEINSSWLNSRWNLNLELWKMASNYMPVWDKCWKIQYLWQSSVAHKIPEAIDYLSMI